MRTREAHSLLGRSQEALVDDRELIRTTLGRLGRRLRLVRGTTASIRFLTAGLALALLPLLLRGLLPVAGSWLAGGVIAGSAILGLLYGVSMRVRAAHVARLADRQLGLKERLACAEEHLSATETTDLVRAQLAETAARIRRLRFRDAFPLRLGPEARMAGPLAALALALVLLPPLPIRFPTGEQPAGQEVPAAEEPTERPLEQKLSIPQLPKEPSPNPTEQDAQRGPLAPHTEPGDQAAIFRDTKVSQQRPDFGSFIKQGDERLKLLARPESLPDLQRDVTQSPYQVMIHRMQEQLKSGSLQGLTWEQIERLLSDLGQAEGRQGGDSSDDLLKEIQEQGKGSQDKMASALSRALSRLREKGDTARGKGKDLREAPSRPEGSGQGKGEGKEDGQDDGGNPGGSLPGTEPSLQTRGAPTPRLGGEKQDAQLEGELREGQTESYDTNLSGLGAKAPSRLPYLDVFSQYRKQMEEALAKEPIPFSYREQVKEYFKALEQK
jgi:hypothetical protein